MPTAWPAKTVLKLIFFLARTDAATAGDHDDPVVERIVDVRKPLVDALGGLINLGRALHVQGFVRTLVVEDLDELVEAGLLLQEVSTRRLGSFLFQGEMHTFMAAVLLRMSRLDPLNADAQAQPPDRLLAQIK